MLNLWVKAVLMGLFAAFVVVVVTALNPWGLNGVSSKAAQDAIQRLTVDSYPIGRPRKPGEQITVVTIDEAGVEVMADAGWAGWPPGLDNLALMISDVALNSGPPPGKPGFRGARAVFADFWVDGPPERQPGEVLTEIGPDGPRPNARGLALQRFDEFLATLGGLTRSEDWKTAPECRADAAMKIACIVAAGGVPVIMARSSDADAARVGTRPVEASVTNAARLQSVAVLASVKIDEMAAEMIAPSAGGAGFSLSPPAALWLASCLTQVKHGGACPELPDARKLLNRAELAIHNAEPGQTQIVKVPPFDTAAALRAVWPVPMSVIWSGRRAQEQDRLQRQTSSSPPPACRSSAPWWDRLGETFLGRLSDVGENRACLPHRMMEYDRLVSGMGLPQTDYDLLLRDRIVLIGSHFDSADWISTPVHGRVPGVHWHAMATDNLLSFGRSYRRADAGLWSWGTLWEVLITFAVTALTTLTIDWAKRATPAGAAKRPLVIVGAGIAVCLAASAAILVIVHFAWTPDPINWIAILAACIVAAVTLIEEATTHRLAPYLHQRLGEPLGRVIVSLVPALKPAGPTAPPDTPAPIATGSPDA